MANLAVEICGLKLRNPIMPAAGPNSKDADILIRAADGGAGALVTKTVSDTAAVIPRPCMASTNSGFLNAEKWSEHTVEHWVENDYPRIKEIGLPVIISIGYTADQIAKVAPLVKPYADAVEMSVHYVGTSMDPMIDALKAAKQALDVPVFMKMSPHTDILEIAKACERNGADGLAMINSVGPCMGIDVRTGLPLMGSENGYGWLTGRTIRPLAVRAIFDVAQQVNIPIIGVGGVASGEDAAEMMMAGASAVQVCTEAILKGPAVYGKIARGLDSFLDCQGYENASDIIGLTHEVIKNRTYTTEAVPPVWDGADCIKCGLCRNACPYNAITIESAVVVDPSLCFGCGLCVTRCPKNSLIFK